LLFCSILDPSGVKVNDRMNERNLIWHPHKVTKHDRWLRKETLRPVGELTRPLVDAGILTIAAFTSPSIEERDLIRKLFGEGESVETYDRRALDGCEASDRKGLYKNPNG
jgi:adenylylsulfate kinase-like enzyme